MKLKVLIVLILLNILVPIKSWGEVLNGTKFESISIDEGLSNEQVTTIFQDSEGYMWIGTKDGLNRYDGENIKIYNCNNKDINSLSSTYIMDIEEDMDGNIWIATDCGLDILIKDTDTVIRMKDRENPYNLGNVKITSILKSSYKENIMWIGTENGLMMVDIENNTIEAFYNEINNPNSLTNSSITCLEEDDNNKLWVGTKKGINTIDKDLNINKNKDDELEDNLYIYCVSKDNEGNIWISTTQGIVEYMGEDGIYFFSSKGIDKYNRDDKSKSKVYEFEDVGVKFHNNFIFHDSENNAWLSSSNGAVKYLRDDRKFEIFQQNNNFKYSLTSNVTTCFYEDSNGTLWIGTDRGVNILNNNSIFNYFYEEERNVVSMLYHDDCILMATKYDGIYVYDENETLVRKIQDENGFTLSDRYIQKIFEADEDHILIVTNKELISYNTKDSSYEELSTEDDYSSELFYLYNDGNKVWVASTTGFYSYDMATGKNTYYTQNIKDKDINPGQITYILQDDKDENILWLGGINIGLIKYHKEKGVMEVYTNDSSNENSLINNYINCMSFDNSGNLWIGTNIGLSKMDPKTNKFTSYTTAEGLTNNYINSIIVDDNSDIWISTNKGLNKFQEKNNDFVNFTNMDGLYGYQFNLNSSLKLEDGTMIFGSTKGFTYFNPDDLADYKKSENKVVIGDILLDQSKVVYDGKELTLDHDYRDLYIDLFLPNYENLNNITYEYMLEGFDSDWIYIGSRSNLVFKYMEPGKYTLKIRARDGHGDQTEETTMNIRVKTPIWKEPFAYVIYISVGLILALYIFNYVKILHHLVNQKTTKLNKQLEENKKLSEEIIENEKFKNNYFVNLSHELRTPINVIVSTVQLMNLLNKNKTITAEKFNQYMNIISKSCDNLLKIISDIVDTSKIETGKYKIHKKDNDIVYIVEEAALNMSEFIEGKGLSLVIDPDMEEQIICCDATEIERCVINLLGNAVKFTDEGGEIRVYIKEVENYIEIIVEDTGIGISKEDQAFIFQRFSQVERTEVIKASSSGIGLALVKYIIELHDGYIKLESELNIGSKFTIAIPIVIENTED